MGIAPEQPENPASLAVFQMAQVASFGDGAPGWALAAYVPAGASAADVPPGGWQKIRVSIGPAAPVSMSRIGGVSGPGVSMAAMTHSSSQRRRVLLCRLLTTTADETLNGASEGDGLDFKVGQLRQGDRLVVPAAVLGVVGAGDGGALLGKGDAAMQVLSVESDRAFWRAEVSV